MVKIVNLFKAAGLWVGTIFLLYGTQDVDRTVAQSYGGYGRTYSTGYGGQAPTRSEGGGRGHSRMYSQMAPSVGFGGDTGDYLREASGQRYSTGQSPHLSGSRSFSIGQEKGL